MSPRYSERTGQLQEYQPGPFDSTHIYVQWGGKLPGNETWSCGFRMWQSGGSTPADANTLLVPVSAALAEFHARAETQISGYAKLSFVKVNAIKTTGEYQAQSTTEATFPDLAGAGTGNYIPANQLAMAITLGTGFSRGPAHKGRFFLPMPNVGPGTDGRISAGVAAEIGTSCDQLRAAVNANSAGHVMVVMSRKAGAAGHRAVTGFTVGRVLDTQRRRRRSLAEDWQ